jgi:hypothetical protein
VNTFSREKRGILELRLRNVSSPEKELRHAFASTQFNRESLVVHLHVAKLIAKRGDMFELLSAQSLSQEQFIQDFNQHRPEALDNAKLNIRGNKLGLEVDERYFPFTDFRLRPYNLEMCLVARFQKGKRRFRFWFDGDDSRAEYDGAGKVRRFIATEDRLKFTYVPEEREVTAARVPLVPEIDSFITSRILEKVELVSETGEECPCYHFEVDPLIQRHVAFALSRTESKQERIAVRGRIAEEINPAILWKAGWIEVRRHPRSIRNEETGPTYPGPDSLMRRKSSGDLYLFEHKWWTDPEFAFREAHAQLRHYRECDIGPETRDVKGAFAAVLDWNPFSAQGELRVQESWKK